MASSETEDASHTDTAMEDIESIEARINELKQEKEKLDTLQSVVDKEIGWSSPITKTNVTSEEKIEADNKSIHVGNVDYSATEQDLQNHFHGCGAILRVTIPKNKFTGQPKGFAYIEFADRDSVEIAMAMDDSLFKGRQIKVIPKRTNIPGISSTNRGPRGASAVRGRGGRGAYRGVTIGGYGRGRGYSLYGPPTRGYAVYRASTRGSRRGRFMPY